MSDASALIRKMNQEPGAASLSSPGAETPLHQHALSNAMPEELPISGFLVLRGQADLAQFVAGVEAVLELPLPKLLASHANSDLRIIWTAPDEWLIQLPIERCFCVEQQLRQKLGGHFAIVNVSGGSTIIRLHGDHAQSILRKSTSYNVNDGNFPVDKAVTTVLAKTQAVIVRVEAKNWHLVVRRSYADYAWDWLVDACSEYLE